MHPESKKVTRDGIYKCEDVFKIFIRAGTTVVPNNTKAQHTFTAPFTGESQAAVDTYRSESENPMYVSDDDCVKCGTVIVDLKNESKETKPLIDVKMLFGDTVITVEATEKGTNKTFDAKINFL